MSKKMERPWGYASERYAERWHGADSRDDAIAKARADDCGDGVIGRGRYPDAGEMASNAVDFEDVLERMDERATDTGFWSEDGLQFEPRGPSSEARRALSNVLRGWAEAYLAATVWTVDMDTIEDVPPVAIVTHRHV